uniref:Zonadhesin n=1 Tax=Phallusia mammillata TaxID=59560 RepID=A0A6F9DYA1_9ASCI|nr:zonadhesin [Phallusia mammillata]
MERFVLALFVIFALCSVGLATTVGTTARSPFCWHEQFFNRAWVPRCHGLFGIYYYPEQCNYQGQCWCVDRRGRSLSVVYHHQGTVDCFRTLTCEPTKVYAVCGGCESTCDERGTLKICTANCRVGCQCPHGTYVEGDRCVTESECPQQTPECDASLNEIYRTCASACESTCTEPDKPCTLQCTQRCTCPPDFVRNDQNVCVPKASCPGACNATLNEQYNSCASACEPTCGQSNSACTLQCTQRCTCPAGHARDEHNVCVPVDACPGACNATLNEVYRSCASACEPTCTNLDQVCSLQCTQRCSCPPGHARDENNVCIPRETCTVACDASLNESFNECAPICDASCDKPRRACNKVKSCTRRCACDRGYVRNGENKCVALDQCPAQNPTTIEGLKKCEGGVCYCLSGSTGSELPGTKRPRDEFDLDCDFLGDCPAEMRFSTCATACPPTCGEPMPKCVRRCVLDCQCPPGMFRASKSNMTCIVLSECPEPHTCQYVYHTTPQGSPMPSCEMDGTWSATQCHDNGTCWCVDEAGVMIPNTMSDTPLVSTDMPTCLEARACDSSLGKEFNLCASPCDGTCARPDRPCATQFSCSARCSCKPGHVLVADGSRCVPVDQCPDRSPRVCNAEKNEVFSTCAPNCDATCETPRIPCSMTRICKRRCACPNGYLRDENDVCVPSDQCPPPAPRSLTACQQDVIKNSDPLLMDAFIPECDNVTGLYKPRQCYGFLNVCWCVNVNDGKTLAGSNGGPSWEYKIDCETYEEPQSSGDGPPAPPRPSSNGDLAPPPIAT